MIMALNQILLLTYLLTYYVHTCWTFTFDLQLWLRLSIPSELWLWPPQTNASSKVSRF